MFDGRISVVTFQTICLRSFDTCTRQLNLTLRCVIKLLKVNHSQRGEVGYNYFNGEYVLNNLYHIGEQISFKIKYCCIQNWSTIIKQLIQYQISIKQMGLSYLTPLLFTELELYLGKHGGMFWFFIFGKIKGNKGELLIIHTVDDCNFLL